MKTKVISRRQFVKGSGALVVSFSMTSYLQPLMASAQATSDVLNTVRSLVPEQLDSWLVIGQDGSVTVYTGRIDMGTGVETAWGQMVAEELDVAFQQVKMVMGDTGLTPDQGKSTASNGVSLGAQPLRTAAAEARQALFRLASTHLKAPLSELVVKDGIVSVVGDSSRQTSYGELIGGRQFDIQLKVNANLTRGPQVEGTARLKSPNKYTIVGQSVPRVDIPAKVTTSFKYVQDVRVPGMLHGRVIRPQGVGASLISLDEDSVRHVPGLVKVVRKADFVGVVAEREEHAIQAARNLKVTWSNTSAFPEYKDLYAATRKAPLLETQVGEDKGDVESALAGAAVSLKATYEYPYQLHAMLGPSCAVADVQKDQATIWSGSQWPQGDRRDLAQMLGMPTEKVHLKWVEASGSYGRLGCDDATADAALLSQTVGRPVRVQWMRHDEHGWEPVSPAMVMDLRAGLDVKGNVVAWDFEHWTSSHATGESGNFLAWRLLGTAPGHGRLSGGPGQSSYVFPNNRLVAHFVEPMLRAIYLRGPGRVQNNFANESFMDELAAAINIDPVEFRLRHLQDSRSIEVLKACAKTAAWETRPSPRQGMGGPVLARGRGVAIGEHSQGQRAAIIVEVEVNRGTGEVRIQRAVIASYCGLIINPDGLRNQIEGAVIQTFSRVLLEELKFDRSKVTSLDWNSYPILRFPEVPDLEVILINDLDAPPSGAGELAVVPIASAISNAIFDATGVRLRRVPFTAERVREALS